MKIVVTGAAGSTGRVLIPQLCARADVSHVAGIDRVPLAWSHPKFSMHPTDLREGSFERSFEGAQAAIHLAFAVLQGRLSTREMHANNVHGSLKVFQAARAQGVRKVVNLSSISVYGSGTLLDETAPLAPPARFPYACHKAELETRANADFSDIDTVHLRSTFILGPNAKPFLRRIFTSRLYIVPHRPYPLLQVIHENDVASAIVAALRPDVRAGAFNIAAPEAVTFPEFVKNGRWLTVGVPIGLVRRCFARETPDPSPFNTFLGLLGTTVTVSCERARSQLGWEPRYSAWQTRASCL